MSGIIKENETYVMLNTVRALENNNKFYEVELKQDIVHVRYGRIGAEGTRLTYPGGRKKFISVIRSKMNKGYRKVDIALNPNGEVQNNKDIVRKAAHVALARSGVSDISDLVDRLVDMNAHEISAGTGGRITVNADGMITTPLGIISQTSIKKAQEILPRIFEEKHSAINLDLANEYLSLIPQKVRSRKNFGELFKTKEARDSQEVLLSQLLASSQWAETQRQNAMNATSDAPSDEEYLSLFRYSITKVTDPDVISGIKKKYNETSKTIHASHKLVLANVYEITDETGKALFDARAEKIGNVRSLWHGTRAMNVLSIMSKGMFVPNNRSGIPIAGRMFGDGVYFSDQSTKSLNYAYGGAPGVGVVDRGVNSYFMFLADVAMGWEYRPNMLGVSYVGSNHIRFAHTGKDENGRSYNSISVKGGTCGVKNNEMIVWETDQINLRYLCEFQEIA